MIKTDDLILICFNPVAGKGKAFFHAKEFEIKLRNSGLNNIVLLSNKDKTSIDKYFDGIDKSINGIVLSLGGDGTINTIINAMIKHKIFMNIGVYPCGTSNDFASSLKMPKNKDVFIRMLKTQQPTFCDLASVNDMFAINAIGSGNFSHAGTVFNAHAKKWFGKLAYYTKCFFSAINMKSNRLRIVSKDIAIEDDFLFYYAVNSRVAGGFVKFSPKGEIDDGKFNFVGIRKCSFIQFCFLFIRILFGTHTKSKFVHYFQTSELTIESVGKNNKFEKSDIDGNIGPNHPLVIKVIKGRIKVYSNKKKVN